MFEVFIHSFKIRPFKLLGIYLTVRKTKHNDIPFYLWLFSSKPWAVVFWNNHPEDSEGKGKALPPQSVHQTLDFTCAMDQPLDCQGLALSSSIVSCALCPYKDATPLQHHSVPAGRGARGPGWRLSPGEAWCREGSAVWGGRSQHFSPSVTGCADFPVPTSQFLLWASIPISPWTTMREEQKA